MATATLSTRASALAPHRFTAAEYYRMVEAGILGEDDRVELLGGQIVDMSPINPPHAATVDRSVRVFTRAVGDRALIRNQNPLDLGEYDAPEPDLALVQPRADEYAEAHPTAAAVLLLVEVADSSLVYDRHVKLPLYAAAGVREAWILNLQERRLEVSQEPREDGYAVTRVYRASERLAPLVFPELDIAVADLLPPGAVERARAAEHQREPGRQ
ncbi:MAG: Uma2 family endonuclease, partial [Chloroflexota bacterium]|nr:Uma2 family endonuclease [Chloroflexota bacterium]